MVAKTKAQAQAELVRRFDEAGLGPRPWNKKTDKGWLTRIYFAALPGFVAINAGRIDIRGMDGHPRFSAVPSIVNDYLDEHGAPVARRAS